MIMALAIEAVQQNIMSRQADNDRQVIDMWLHGRPDDTQRAYSQDVAEVFRFTGKGIRSLSLGDLQAYSDTLNVLTEEGARKYKDTTKARKLAAIKSLLKFAHRLGFVPFDVGAVIKLPKLKNTLAERIMSEESTMRIIYSEPNKRNRVLLRTLYATGARVSEICGLKWKDTQDRDNGQGQVTLYGKGGKTRVVLVSADTWKEIKSIKGKSTGEHPVFRSRKHTISTCGHLDPAQIQRIIKAAAVRAGVDGNVSPHWFRHAHASHSLDKGCPIHEVAQTLGHSSLATTSRYTHARPNSSSALYLAV
jgi:integrase/recombinase XerD